MFRICKEWKFVYRVLKIVYIWTDPSGYIIFVYLLRSLSIIIIQLFFSKSESENIKTSLCAHKHLFHILNRERCKLKPYVWNNSSDMTSAEGWYSICDEVMRSGHHELVVSLSKTSRHETCIRQPDKCPIDLSKWL